MQDYLLLLAGIVVAEINRTQVGMVVDAVSQVLRVPDTAIEPPSPVVATVDSAFISGIAKVGNRLIVLLNLAKILQPDEEAALPQAALPPEPSSPAVEGLVDVGPPPEGHPGEPLPASPKKRKRKGPRRPGRLAED